MPETLHIETLILGTLFGALLTAAVVMFRKLLSEGPESDMDSEFPEDGITGREAWGDTLNQLPDVNPVRSVVMPSQQPEPVQRIKRFPVQLPR